MKSPETTDKPLHETLEILNLQSGESLLEVGCGDGHLLARLSQTVPGAELHGVEASLTALAAIRRKLGDNAALKQGRAEKLPFPDHCFDAVASINAIHRVEYPLAALMEMLRVLRPGGRVVITDWCRDFSGCRLYDPWLRIADTAHNRILGRAEVRNFLHRAGFTDARVLRYRVNGFLGAMTVTAVPAEKDREAEPDYTRKRGIRAM